jgi:hypothetical protein
VNTETNIHRNRFEFHEAVFFHIDGESRHRDEIGEELKDDSAAWLEATRLVRDVEVIYDQVILDVWMSDWGDR